VAVANYSLLAFLDISLRALQPLYYTTPIVLGGLGFDPSTVGLCLAGFSVVSGVWQLLVFPSLYDRLGTKRVFVLAVSTFVPMFALFPVMTVIAKESGVGPAIWLALCAQGLLYVIMDMGFSKPHISRAHQLHWSSSCASRLCLRLRSRGCAERPRARRHEWHRTDQHLRGAHNWPGTVKFALRAISSTQHIGWRFRVRGLHRNHDRRAGCEHIPAQRTVGQVQ
jgi:hypothetical protein